MNIREELEREHSKVQTMRIVRFIDNDAKRFDELMQVFLGKDAQLAQRAAWCLRYAGAKNPNLYLAYMPQMFALLQQARIHPALRRNILRVWEEIDVPEEYHGEMIEHCTAILQNPSDQTVAKCYAMSVLAKFCNTYPELKQETALLIRPFAAHEKAAFASRARKVLRQIRLAEIP